MYLSSKIKNHTKSVFQGRASVQGRAEGVRAQQRMSGGGAGEERSGPAREAARGGGGEQCPAQRTQGLPLRGPGLRPAGEMLIFVSFSSFISKVCITPLLPP